MRPYLIWSLNYRHDSAGQKVLHRLCHELNEAGQEAYVAYPRRNAAWNTPYHPSPLTGDWTAIYPEIVHGNPWRAPHVARWVLNTPGLLGGDTAYDASEMVFTYSRIFTDAPLLMLPAIELDIYIDEHVPRLGSDLYYVGKGRKTRDMGAAVEITKAVKSHRETLVHMLNRTRVLYSFDIISGMNTIATLCGCPVVLIPDGYRTPDQVEQTIGIGWDELPPPFDSDVIRQEQIALYAVFKTQLAHFIDITQSQP